MRIFQKGLYLSLDYGTGNVRKLELDPEERLQDEDLRPMVFQMEKKRCLAGGNSQFSPFNTAPNSAFSLRRGRIESNGSGMENKSANEALVLNIDFQQLFIMKIPYSVLMVFWIGIHGGFLVHATETDILERIQQRLSDNFQFSRKFCTEQLYYPTRKTS